MRLCSAADLQCQRTYIYEYFCVIHPRCSETHLGEALHSEARVSCRIEKLLSKSPQLMVIPAATLIEPSLKPLLASFFPLMRSRWVPLSRE